MLREFLVEQKKQLAIGLILMGIILAAKFGTPQMYENSRYTTLLDLSLIFLLPAGFLWEWFHFKKKRDKKKDK